MTPLFELLDPPPAGRGGESYLLADVGDGAGAILLQDPEDLDIHLIEHLRCPPLRMAGTGARRI
jgi:hypothetical protein